MDAPRPPQGPGLAPTSAEHAPGATGRAVRRHGPRAVLRHLYEAGTPAARRFRYGLLVMDFASVAWIVATSFLRPGPFVVGVDLVLGLVLAAEFAVRVSASGAPLRHLLNPLNLVDLVSIASLLLAPLLGAGLAFLRVLRTFRLLHSVRLVASLRSDLPFFRRNEDAALAAIQLGIFIFVMTGLVYETQHWHNPNITNYGDALYFTVTALTTTGFGDITLPGLTGRLLTVVIMLAGVTLFLRLAQALFQPVRVRVPCGGCGLARHEPDAVHCKACGALLNSPAAGGPGGP